MQAKKVLKFLTLFADNVYIDYNKKEQIARRKKTMKTTTKLYSLTNLQGNYFDTCEAATIRKAINIFKKSYSGQFVVNGDGEAKRVTL